MRRATQRPWARGQIRPAAKSGPRPNLVGGRKRASDDRAAAGSAAVISGNGWIEISGIGRRKASATLVSFLRMTGTG